jgi:putative addiction module component (TIGR02574 family)
VPPVYCAEVLRAPTLMSTPIPFPPPGFDDLSTDEKIDYLASLWDRITTRPATIDVPECHREVIVERLRDLDLDPNSGDQWEIVQTRLRERLGTKR